MNLFAEITDRIISELEKGNIPWHRPWTGTRNGAWSRSTGKPYSLLNQMLLAKPGEYVTFKQALDAGGCVRKGEKAKMVVFWKPLPVTDKDADGNDIKKTVPMLKYFNVFHIDQCDGITQKHHPEEVKPFNPVEQAESVATAYAARTGCRINHEASNRAFYRPSTDTVTLPLREQFPETGEYYSTLYHEITHSTGHSSRLDRLAKDAAFGSEEYSREELVAEIGAAACVNELGIETPSTFKNSAAYIQSWIHALRNDNRMIVVAAGKAEKAVNLIFNRTASHNEEQADAPSVLPAAPVESVPARKEINPSKAEKPRYNAVLRFAKDCVKHETRENLRGSFIAPDTKHQTVCNGFILWASAKPLEGLPVVEFKGDLMQTAKVVDGARFEKTFALPDLNALKAAYKAARTAFTGKHFSHTTDLENGTHVNTAFLIHCLEMLGSPTTFRQKEKSPLSPLYLESGDGAYCILCPVRKQAAA